MDVTTAYFTVVLIGFYDSFDTFLTSSTWEYVERLLGGQDSAIKRTEVWTKVID